MRSNEAALQRGIKDMQLQIKSGLPPNELIFLDRALPDCLAWFRVFGLDPNEFLQDCFHYRYASVFMLDRLSLQPNGFRYQDETLLDFTSEWHRKDYTALGYGLIRVPVLPPEERLAFVLGVLCEQGLL